MEPLQISLFGRFRAHFGDRNPVDLEAGKAQELLCYLLLHRDHPHAREALASRLWGDHCTTTQSRKYLRNSLWQLQSVLNRHQDAADDGLLLVEPDWIQLRAGPGLSLDVAAFEAAYHSVRGVHGKDIGLELAQALQRAAALYTGDLLESWQMEWCLYERERLVHVHLLILDKLVAYCATHGLYEEGLSYGERILQCDRAREYTHRQMMWLYYLSQDRTGALRQFGRCADALKEELAVAPSQETVLLYDSIRRGVPLDAPAKGSLHDFLVSLHWLQSSLADLQHHVQHVLEVAEGALDRERCQGAEPAGQEPAPQP